MNNEKTLLELVEEKEKYELFFRKAPLPFQSLDEDGRFLDVNEIWLHILGYNREEVIGQWFGDFLYDEKQREEFAKNFAHFKKMGFIYNVQFNMKKRDSSPIFVSFDGKIAFDQNGHFKQTYCIFRDITQEKKLQAEIEQIKWLLTRNTDDLYQQSGPPFYGDLTILNTNRTILDSVGKQTLQKLAGETIDLLESSIAIYEQNGDYATGLFSSGWCQLLDSQSRKLCAESTNREALKSGKWICHESCWAHAKKAMETGNIVDSHCDGGLKIYAVPIFVGENVIGALSVGYANPPEDIRILKKLSKKFLVPLEVLIEKKEAYRKRPPYIIELAKKKIRTTSELIGMLVQLKLTEKKLRQSESEAKSANKAKSQFLANMNHELRTPLNGIIGFADILSETSLDSEQREYLDIIYTSGKLLTDIIADILDFSRIEAGKFELNSEKVNLRPLIEKTVSIVRYRAESKGLDLSVNIGNEVPQTVEMDGPRLSQILLNLLSNAVKFTDNGSVQLTVNLLEKQTDKARLLFAVTDTGVGIKEQDQQKVFDPFQQTDMTSSKKAEGTGLGLAISKKMLELMGAPLQLKSIYGKGSTFYFDVLLPIKEEQLTDSDKVLHEEIAENASYTNKKILIAEDNPVNMHYAQSAISKFSNEIQIFKAKNGKEAYYLFREHHPDLVLMDIIMPELDGYQATAMIRSQDQQIPIIAMTAKALKEEKADCMTAGMNDYITKPFSLERLKGTLKKYL